LGLGALRCAWWGRASDSVYLSARRVLRKRPHDLVRGGALRGGGGRRGEGSSGVRVRGWARGWVTDNGEARSWRRRTLDGRPRRGRFSAAAGASAGRDFAAVVGFARATTDGAEAAAEAPSAAQITDDVDVDRRRRQAVRARPAAVVARLSSSGDRARGRQGGPADGTDGARPRRRRRGEPKETERRTHGGRCD